MSAQPSDTAGPVRSVITLPRTIRAVRAALPEDKRAAFNAEMEVGDVPETFNRWWTVAAVYSSPATMAELAKIKAGTWHGTDAAEVFGDRWTAVV